MKTIKQAFNSGMEEFAKHCLRYGDIVGDDSYTCPNTGKECRDYTVAVQGCFVEITKRNGEVIAVSYNEAMYA